MTPLNLKLKRGDKIPDRCFKKTTAIPPICLQKDACLIVFCLCIVSKQRCNPPFPPPKKKKKKKSLN